jgi:hypothetical protein
MELLDMCGAQATHKLQAAIQQLSIRIEIWVIKIFLIIGMVKTFQS